MEVGGSFQDASKTFLEASTASVEAFTTYMEVEAFTTYMEASTASVEASTPWKLEAPMKAITGDHS